MLFLFCCCSLWWLTTDNCNINLTSGTILLFFNVWSMILQVIDIDLTDYMKDGSSWKCDPFGSSNPLFDKIKLNVYYTCSQCWQDHKIKYCMISLPQPMQFVGCLYLSEILIRSVVWVSKYWAQCMQAEVSKLLCKNLG